MHYERRVHAQALVAFAENHPNAVVLSGDLTASCEADEFKRAFPDRFISLGLMEQNMMGFAAGLARQGLIPLVHTFAVFMYRRALDQIEMSIAYPNLPVRILGFLPGVTTPGGASHQATNDVGVLRTVPNMTVLETADATDVETLLPAIADIDGPVYVRMVRGEIPRLFERDDHFVVGKARILAPVEEVCVLSSGICTQEAMVALARVRGTGATVGHLHITTLKPFNDPAVLDAIARARVLITYENHNVVGGLGTAVAEVIADTGSRARLVRIGIPDTYMAGASKEFLMRHYGLDQNRLLGVLGKVLSTEFASSADPGVHFAHDYVDTAKLEAL